METLSATLRQVYVKELLGEHRVNYSPYIQHTDLNYDKEANRFANNHYFDSELGNTMPLALATALQISIVIFHKDPNTPNTPIMYVTPEIVTTEASAFLVYTRSEVGHYDAAVPCHKMGAPTSNSKSNSCRCGANKTNASAKSCMPSAIYTTRCKCFKASQPCTVQHFANAQTVPPPLQGDQRSRRKHPLQINIPSSKRLAQERGECMSQAIWSNFESIVLHEICTSLRQESDNSMIAKLYNDVVYYSTTSICLFTLPQDIVFRKKAKVKSLVRSTTLQFVTLHFDSLTS